MQLDIVDVATSLARETKVQSSVAIIGALSDMMRHLRKSIHCSLDDSNLGTEVIEWNRKFRAAVDDCLVELTHKVMVTSFIFPLVDQCLVQWTRSVDFSFPVFVFLFCLINPVSFYTRGKNDPNKCLISNNYTYN